jgi:glutathione S-transferase
LFEQYNHEPNIATLRFWMMWIGEAALSETQRMMLPGKRSSGEEALALMAAELDSRDWLVGTAPSVADICLYAYTHVADGGGFDLARWPSLGRWIKRVEALPGYVPMSD